MKKLIVMLCAIIPGMLMAQSFSEKINKELTFDKKVNPTFIVININ